MSCEVTSSYDVWHELSLRPDMKQVLTSSVDSVAAYTAKATLFSRMKMVFAGRITATFTIVLAKVRDCSRYTGILRSQTVRDSCWSKGIWCLCLRGSRDIRYNHGGLVVFSWLVEMKCDLCMTSEWLAWPSVQWHPSAVRALSLWADVGGFVYRVCIGLLVGHAE